MATLVSSVRKVQVKKKIIKTILTIPGDSRWWVILPRLFMISRGAPNYVGVGSTPECVASVFLLTVTDSERNF